MTVVTSEGTARDPIILLVVSIDKVWGTVTAVPGGPPLANNYDGTTTSPANISKPFVSFAGGDQASRVRAATERRVGHTRREGAVTDTSSMKMDQVGGAQLVHEEPRRGNTGIGTAAEAGRGSRSSIQ